MAQATAEVIASLDPELRAEAERISKQMHISPPGSLGLPKLLDDRRLEYDIPDGAFGAHAVFDRVLVYQIDRVRTATFENSLIHRPDISRAREREECPVGVIVGAGLSALDSLRSHGVDLGHVCIFVHLAPFRFQCGTIDGHPVYVLLLRAGDIIASMDLMGKTKDASWQVKSYEQKLQSGISVRRHYLDKGDGSVTVPEDGIIFEE